jgi:hypothetical protein
MNVNKKNEVTYSITDITEGQAQGLLTLACNDGGLSSIDIKDGGEFCLAETLDNLRQALLTAGVEKKG